MSCKHSCCLAWSALQTAKALAILENQLEQAYCRANKRRAETRVLRSSIDGLRRCCCHVVMTQGFLHHMDVIPLHAWRRGRERLALEEALRKIERVKGACRARVADLLRAGHAAEQARDKARRRSLHARCQNDYRPV